MKILTCFVIKLYIWLTRLKSPASVLIRQVKHQGVVKLNPHLSIDRYAIYPPDQLIDSEIKLTWLDYWNAIILDLLFSVLTFKTELFWVAELRISQQY